MKLDLLQKKLLAAARRDPPSDRVPYAFEQRVLAQLRAESTGDVAALWARALWRAVIPCVAVAVVLAALAFVPSQSTAASEVDLSQAFEQTLLGATNQTEGLW